jgi:hypothetical protein
LRDIKKKRALKVFGPKRSLADMTPEELLKEDFI